MIIISKAVDYHSSLFDVDCGGFVHLQDNDAIFERDRDVSVTSPNFPGSIGVGKICRWAITVMIVYEIL